MIELAGEEGLYLLIQGRTDPAHLGAGDTGLDAERLDQLVH